MTDEVKFTIHAGPLTDDPRPWPEKCPRCGSETEDGYGLMGGGIGPYRYCTGDDCDWMVKEQDRDE